MSLLYQRSYFYYTQITKNFKRNTLSDNTADFSHQRHGPRNQPQDNERIPDPIRQRVVTVIPAGEQRRHKQRIRQQLGKLKTERYSSFESRITTMLDDVRKLKSLIDELEQPLEVFDEKLFHEIVTDICINNRDEMTATLLGGLKFTEQI